MKNKIKYYLRSNFFRNMTIMITGTVSAQIISLILSPIITRLYGPEAYGIMGTFNSLINIFIPIAALTYPYAIVLPQKDSHAKKIAKLSVICSFVMGIVFFIFIFIFREAIIEFLNFNLNSLYLFLVPIIIIFSGVLQVYEQMAIRTEQFSINARTTFLDSIIINVTKVGIGFYYPSETVLIILTSLRNVLQTFFITSLFNISNFNERKQYEEDSISLAELAKKYIDFPLYRAPEASFNAMTRGLPVLTLTAIFGSISAGYYSLAWSVLSLPTALVGKAISEVIYPRIVKAINSRENVFKLLKHSTTFLGMIGLIPFGLVFFFGPELFSLVFGDEWRMAGEYARWISLFGYTNFINKPCISSLAALRAQNLHLIITIVSLVIKLVSLVVGFYLFYSDVIAVALFSMSGAVLNIIFIFNILKMSKTINEI